MYFKAPFLFLINHQDVLYPRILPYFSLLFADPMFYRTIRFFRWFGEAILQEIHHSIIPKVRVDLAIVSREATLNVCGLHHLRIQNSIPVMMTHLAKLKLQSLICFFVIYLKLVI